MVQVGSQNKTIYVFTSGQITVTISHSPNTQMEFFLKIKFKGVKMTIAKWTINTGEQQDLLSIIF